MADEENKNEESPKRQEDSVQEAAAPNGAQTPEVKAPDGPRKILDALDQQSAAVSLEPSSLEISGGQEDIALEDLPLPPGADKDDPGKESPDVQPGPGATVDADRMISEAMKKLDQILEGMKSEGASSQQDIAADPVDDTGP